MKKMLILLFFFTTNYGMNVTTPETLNNVKLTTFADGSKLLIGYNQYGIQTEARKSTHEAEYKVRIHFPDKLYLVSAVSLSPELAQQEVKKLLACLHKADE